MYKRIPAFLKDMREKAGLTQRDIGKGFLQYSTLWGHKRNHGFRRFINYRTNPLFNRGRRGKIDLFGMSGKLDI